MFKQAMRVAGCVAAVVCGGLPAADVSAAEAAEMVRSAASGWPQWRGPRRDGISEESGLLQSWPEGGPKLLWKAVGIGRGYSAPIVAGDAVYVTGDQEKELVISALTLDGQPLWKAANGAPWKNPYPGARSSCCYADGRLYHLNAHGSLVCLDAKTGAAKWSASLLERYEGKNIMWGISESVLVDGGRVFATPAGAKGLMVALDAATGEQAWATPGLEGEQASYSSPVLVQAGGRRLLVNCSSKHAFAVDEATGALAWKLQHLDPKNTVNVTPMLSGGALFFNNSSRDAGFVFGVPLGAEPVARSWTRELKIGHGGMVCVGGRLYGASSKGELRGWVSFDAATGAAALAAPQDALADGSVIAADGRLYCLTARGLMTLQEPGASGLKAAGAFKLTEGQAQDAWTHPVLCQGRLYLRYHDALSCYDVRRTP